MKSKALKLVYYAYPKVNLGLNVYELDSMYNKHQLESIFVLIDNWKKDEIIIEFNANQIDQVIYYQKQEPLIIENDLITKCLIYFRNKWNFKDYFKIKVNKNIPMKAGLGGASSDTAIIIDFLLNQYQRKLDDDLMKEIALNLGSDICFFLTHIKIGLVSEFGNKVKPLSIKKPDILILDNHYQCDTKSIFNQFDLLSKHIDFKKNDYDYLIHNWNQLNSYQLVNNLQDVVLTYNKQLFDYYQQLKNHYQNQNIIMTGSGSFFILIK